MFSGYLDPLVQINRQTHTYPVTLIQGLKDIAARFWDDFGLHPSKAKSLEARGEATGKYINYCALFRV